MTAVSVASDSRPTPLIAVSVETLAYLLVFIVACIFRVVNLGSVPLGEVEAQHALAVQHLVNPLRPAVGQIENPVTFVAMTLSMGIMGLGDGSARTMPMLAGLALVLSPILFRDRLGRLPALIISALLAVSPVAVAMSRQADGTIFAALALAVMLAGIDRYVRSMQSRALIVIGVALGIAIMADHTSLLAMIALLVGLIFAAFTDEEGEIDFTALRDFAAATPFRIPLIAMVVTILIVGSLFFLAPEGLGASADQLGRFAQGLISRTPGVAWVGLSILLYEPGLVIFGLLGVWLASQSTIGWQRWLAGWGFAALIIVLIYPGALPGHALWIVLPFAALSGLTLATLLSLRPESAPWWVSWMHGALVVGLFGMIFASLSLYLESPRLMPIAMGTQPGQPAPGIPIDLILVAAWIVFIVVMWLFVASVWETSVAWRGLGIGLLAFTSLIAIGQAGSLAFTRAHSAYEPLNRLPAQPGLVELIETIDDIGDLSVGNAVDPTITVQGEQNYALIWALRAQSNVTYTPAIDPTVTTDLVITPADGVDPALGSAYVGQDFLIVRQWLPRGLNLSNFIEWLLYRTAPTPSTDVRVILWVREDLYRLVPAGGAAE